MKTIGFASQHCNVIRVLSISILIIILFQPLQAFGQVRAGMGYLKMAPGTRELGVAGTLTGALDYSYSFHANPGATGFLREWQYSASYTRWISDIYNASFLYGKRVKSLWSRQTRFALGINYQGIPEFDSSNELAAPVAGNNLLVTTSFGQPINFISPHISIGANIKYFNSRLAQFEANSLIFDYGLLYRTNRFGFLKPGTGLFDYAILSAGVAITNSGNSIKYISEGTPLPRTLRTGIALNLGTHNGFQLNLATDYRQVRDEAGFVTFGSEINWSQFISMRMGYSFEDNLLGHFTFGASMQLDDAMIKSIIPGKNNAMRFDLASNQNNDLMASPYHGSLNYFPIGPENFKLIGPSRDATINNDIVTLNWQDTRDPDLFDDIDYWLLLDIDSTKIAKIIEIGKRSKDELFDFLKKYDDLQVSQILDFTHFKLNELKSGDYYWAVFSYDKDRHFRFAEMQNEPVARFRVTQPDPKIISIDFHYSPWITTADSQGILQVTIANFGNRTANNFSLSIYDSASIQPMDNSNINTGVAADETFLSQQTLPDIKPGDLDTIKIDWRTDRAGYHSIVAKITKLKSDSATEPVINQYSDGFYTIPKGTFATDDTVIVQNLKQITYELPYVGKVFFESNSSEVDQKSFPDSIMSPPLTRFAEQATKDTSIQIDLKGSVDKKAGEQDSIAMARADAVRKTLDSLGVSKNPIGKSDTLVITKYRLPSKPGKDADWIKQEKKFVEILVDPAKEKEFFKPFQSIYNSIIGRSPVSFEAKISGAVPIEKGMILLSTTDLADTLNMNDLNYTENIDTTFDWPSSENNNEKPDKWIGSVVNYSLVIIDTLGRQFKTYPQNVFLKKKIIGKEKMYYIIAKFTKPEVLYQFYWSNLLDSIPSLLKDEKTQMCFEGHCCAIGPDIINDSLSTKRARYFRQKFLDDVEAKYPWIKQRIDKPIGRGENEPLAFIYRGKTIVLGDNKTPIGRLLNRRVMVRFYTK